jgi:hypothetical protein
VTMMRACFTEFFLALCALISAASLLREPP